MTALASRLLAEVIRIANEYRDGILDSSEMEREAAAALSGREAVAWYITWNDGTTEVSPDPCCPDDGSCVALYLATTPQPGDGVDAARLDWLRDNEFDLVTRREDIDEDEYRILWFVIDPRKTTRRHLHSISGHPLGSPREAIDAAIARSTAPSAKGVAP